MSSQACRCMLNAISQKSLIRLQAVLTWRRKMLLVIVLLVIVLLVIVRGVEGMEHRPI